MTTEEVLRQSHNYHVYETDLDWRKKYCEVVSGVTQTPVMLSMAPKWVAECGVIFGWGQTKEQALEDLARSMEWAHKTGLI